MDISAHEKPCPELKALYKKYQKCSVADLERDDALVDFCRGLSADQTNLFECSPFVAEDEYTRILSNFLGYVPNEPLDGEHSWGLPVSYACKTLPGLTVIPSLLSTKSQTVLLDKLLHRDLSNPEHKTNVHFHHDLEYPREGKSFFQLQPNDSETVVPKQGSGQKPISMQKFFNKSLRWMTLGGQYDWTKKTYPNETPPGFPEDLQRLLRGLFPETTAEAAIVNFYSPGDVLSLHRDVSEYCDKGLISLSIGCDGVFIVALDGDDERHGVNLVIRLRSGDAVYMDGKSRYAWHGVPRVIAGTCPEQLRSWPINPVHENLEDSTQSMRQWSSWLASKRINLNVRQMWSDEARPNNETS